MKDKLIELGFEVLDDDFKMENDIDKDDPLYYREGFIYTLGHSRRGQWYYFLIDGASISIYASNAEGSPGTLELKEVHLQVLNAVFELLRSEP